MKCLRNVKVEELGNILDRYYVRKYFFHSSARNFSSRLFLFFCFENLKYSHRILSYRFFPMNFRFRQLFFFLFFIIYYLPRKFEVFYRFIHKLSFPNSNYFFSTNFHWDFSNLSNYFSFSFLFIPSSKI